MATNDKISEAFSSAFYLKIVCLLVFCMSTFLLHYFIKTTGHTFYKGCTVLQADFFHPNFFVAVTSSSAVIGCFSAILIIMKLQKCSIGFMSGLFPHQSRTSILFSQRFLEITFNLGHGAPSCMNIKVVHHHVYIQLFLKQFNTSQAIHGMPEQRKYSPAGICLLIHLQTIWLGSVSLDRWCTLHIRSLLFWSSKILFWTAELWIYQRIKLFPVFFPQCCEDVYNLFSNAHTWFYCWL